MTLCWTNFSVKTPTSSQIYASFFWTNPSGGSEKKNPSKSHLPLVTTSLFQRLWGENLTQELRNIAKATPANRTVTSDEVSRVGEVGWMLREGGKRRAAVLVGWGAVGDIRWKGNEKVRMIEPKVEETVWLRMLEL